MTGPRDRRDARELPFLLARRGKPAAAKCSIPCRRRFRSHDGSVAARGRDKTIAIGQIGVALRAGHGRGESCGCPYAFAAGGGRRFWLEPAVAFVFELERELLAAGLHDAAADSTCTKSGTM